MLLYKKAESHMKCMPNYKWIATCDYKFDYTIFSYAFLGNIIHVCGQTFNVFQLLTICMLKGALIRSLAALWPSGTQISLKVETWQADGVTIAAKMKTYYL